MILITPEDVPADFITRELAARWANELFQKWAKENNVCTHSSESIRARILNWDPKECQFYCKCGIRMEPTKWKPANTQTTPLSYSSDTAVR